MRRIAAIGAVVVAMLAAVAIAAVLLVENANAKTTAWVVTRDLATGATVDATAAHQIQVPTGTDTYTVLTDSPVGKQVSHVLRAGDVLRPDDFVTSTMVQVPVSFKLAPGLTANDVVDIYAVGSGSSTGAVNSAVGTRLIARRITVVAVGSPSVIEVPANQEPLWVTLSSSSVTLIAARSDGVNVPSADHSYSTDEVLNLLAQLAAANSDGSGSPVPSPSPSGGP
jgi:hypothetical protein